MLRKLYLAAAAWTVTGLLSGLFYREFTKAMNVNGGTQLALVHTHSLMLGTAMLLIVMALVKVFHLSGRPLTAFFWVWNAGLLVTVSTLVIKGIFQVMKNTVAANNAALAGIAGLGHITLTVGFVLLFVALAPAMSSKVTPASATPSRADAGWDADPRPASAWSNDRQEEA